MERGKLTIFFGYSAGVGKTYAMLKKARGLKDAGADVVIGYLEPHARPDTMALAEGFERVPLRQIDYRGAELAEFDVDAALARKPALVLVDELAHTNASGSKHRKRYLDVLELVNNGVSVYTTVNVQHLAGLNDFVGDATDVAVSETVPDEVFDCADEVELIDLEPAELLERFREGKIYRADRISAALSNFFTPEHLDALRELGLRRTADRIQKAQREGERRNDVLVLIGPAPSGARNIRIAARMAEAYHCRFAAIYVERNGALDDESAASIKAHMKLAQDLGGEVIVKYGEDVIEAIAGYIRLNQVSHIIVGKTWQSVGKRVGFEDRVVSAFPECDVLVVPDRQSIRRPAKAAGKRLLRGRDGLALALCAVTVALSFLLLLVDAYAAVAVQTAASVLLCALLIRASVRLARVKLRYAQSNRALDAIRLLSDGIDGVSLEEALAEGLARVFSRSVRFLTPGADVTILWRGEPAGLFDGPQEQAVADWAFQNAKPAGCGTETLRSAHAAYYPVRGRERGVCAVVGLSCAREKLTVTEKLLFAQIRSFLAGVLAASAAEKET